MSFAREVIVTDDEANEVGVYENTQNWGDLMSPLLIRKGMDPRICWFGNEALRFTRSPRNTATIFYDVRQ